MPPAACRLYVYDPRRGRGKTQLASSGLGSSYRMMNRAPALFAVSTACPPNCPESQSPGAIVSVRAWPGRQGPVAQGSAKRHSLRSGLLYNRKNKPPQRIVQAGHAVQ